LNFFTSTNGIFLKIQLFPFTKKLLLFGKKNVTISNISENNVEVARVVVGSLEKWVA